MFMVATPLAHMKKHALGLGTGHTLVVSPARLLAWRDLPGFVEVARVRVGTKRELLCWWPLIAVVVVIVQLRIPLG